MNYEANVGEH